MIDERLLQQLLWLGILAVTVAAVRYTVLQLCRSLRPWAGGALHRLRSTAFWRAAAQAGAQLDGKTPGLTAVLRARLDTERFHGWPLTAVGICIVIIVALFVEIAEYALDEKEVTGFDDAILAALSGLRVEPALSLFAWITELGGNPALAAATLVAGGLLWAGRHGHLLLGLCVTVVGSQTTLWIGKFGFDRARPDFLTDVTAGSPSFPSGHTTGAMAIYGIIAYAVASLVPAFSARAEIAFWAAMGILLIGFSRIYLHVHYPSDVLGGILIGGLWLLVGVAVAQWHGATKTRLPKARGAPDARSASLDPSRSLEHQNDV